MAAGEKICPLFAGALFLQLEMLMKRGGICPHLSKGSVHFLKLRKETV